MKLNLLYSALMLVLLQSCSNTTHTCQCTDKAKENKEIASYKLEGKKETASFECKQKTLQYSGPAYGDVQCVLK